MARNPLGNSSVETREYSHRNSLIKETELVWIPKGKVKIEVITSTLLTRIHIVMRAMSKLLAEVTIITMWANKIPKHHTRIMKIKICHREANLTPEVKIRIIQANKIWLCSNQIIAEAISWIWAQAVILFINPKKGNTWATTWTSRTFQVPWAIIIISRTTKFVKTQKVRVKLKEEIRIIIITSISKNMEAVPEISQLARQALVQETTHSWLPSTPRALSKPTIRATKLAESVTVRMEAAPLTCRRKMSTKMQRLVHQITTIVLVVLIQILARLLLEDLNTIFINKTPNRSFTITTPTYRVPNRHQAFATRSRCTK